MINDKIKRIIKRNLQEITVSYNMHIALKSMWKDNPKIFPDEFLGLCSIALFNEIISHLIKVLDINKQSATFYTIYEQLSEEVDKILKNNKMNIEFIKMMTKRLRLIRDKTHFHIDKRRFMEAPMVWKEADITFNELEKTIKILHLVLNKLYKKFVSRMEPFVIYNGSDASFVVKLVKDNQAKL